MDSNATLHFLNHLLSVFPLQPILFFLDHTPWHRGQAIRTFLTHHPRLQRILNVMDDAGLYLILFGFIATKGLIHDYWRAAA